MAKRQELYLVFGGELIDLARDLFAAPETLHLVGVYQSYKKAEEAWRGATARTVDNAMIRYFIAPLHELLHPSRPRPKRRKRG
ncbi:MAG: DUF4170 domain-containing protein [Alphaproteobacteria bacterium]|nr:DUF4170 domain-containing protein [Alphaproteobacteria bacterium]